MARTPKNRSKGSAEGSENEENVHQLSLVPRRNSIASLGRAQVLESQRTGSHPAAQVVPSSGLGVALGNIARMERDLSDPSDESSDYESSVYT